MKLNTTTQPSSRRNITCGFTLLEMIGVLAVIAILAAVLIPKVFAAIDNARVSNAAMSCNTVKTAIIDHYSKFGSLIAGINPTAPQTFTVPSANYDSNLVTELFLDKPFAAKIGDGTAATTIELDACAVTNTTPTAPNVSTPGTGGTAQAAFNLDGRADANTINQAIGSDVLYAVISNVNLNDARALKALIDGHSAVFAENSDGVALKGRVKYNFGGTDGTPTAVYIYLTHR